ncbi:dialkylrecorsinol condensing enzyme DarA [Flavobacterium sp. I3-2]|uniref:dialkylrecorsinol condensing enzyme DarA n=1 Tax=Flavobacterium sp. I3-2 TaxID=2748319 RepID=UPI0015A8657A|nr:dialkylrecorsinol condensing enzyme DarA [Flavobacterium sp. I3-2]
MKNVLVIYYSQSGQLKEIADQISQPFIKDENVRVDYYQIQMQNEFPFPWDKDSFFGAFPDSFQQVPHQILLPSESILNTNYDLILFHYQVWYLTPSIPINSFLKSDYAKKILQNKSVVTISGSRNMWALAQDKMKILLHDNNAKLVGNIALVDRNINLISVVTVVDWMFSGIKKKAYGIFPLPGVSEAEIKESSKFGTIIYNHFLNENYTGLQTELVANGAVEFRHFLISMDKKANKMFKIWAKIISSNPNKKKILTKLFNYYLFVAIWVLSPIVHLIETILYPVLYFKIRKQKKYYQGI